MPEVPSFNDTILWFVKDLIPRLSSVTRWNGTDVLRRDNIAEHSFGVAMLAGVVAVAENRLTGNQSIELSKVYQYALWHDFPEIFSGDINYMFKQYSEKFSDMYEVTLRDFSKERCFNRMENGSLFYDSCYPSEEERKSKEFRIVDYCDMLQLLSYCLAEYRKGNTQMEEIINRALAIADVRKTGIKVLECLHLDLLTQVSRVMRQV